MYTSYKDSNSPHRTGQSISGLDEHLNVNLILYLILLNLVPSTTRWVGNIPPFLLCVFDLLLMCCRVHNDIPDSIWRTVY